ncbi:MAG: hypothetical protein Q7J84_14145 [Sulfuricaulis sp.]|nr:hypothetical protein [Sulfuricaulis sp.]
MTPRWLTLALAHSFPGVKVATAERRKDRFGTAAPLPPAPGSSASLMRLSSIFFNRESEVMTSSSAGSLVRTMVPMGART